MRGRDPRVVVWRRRAIHQASNEGSFSSTRRIEECAYETLEQRPRCSATKQHSETHLEGKNQLALESATMFKSLPNASILLLSMKDSIKTARAMNPVDSVGIELSWLADATRVTTRNMKNPCKRPNPLSSRTGSTVHLASMLQPRAALSGLAASWGAPSTILAADGKSRGLFSPTTRARRARLPPLERESVSVTR